MPEICADNEGLIMKEKETRLLAQTSVEYGDFVPVFLVEYDQIFTEVFLDEFLWTEILY